MSQLWLNEELLPVGPGFTYLITLWGGMERFAGSPQENEDGRKRKRKEAWAEERECQQEKKRRKEERKRYPVVIST